jgi:hypothetical protein
LVLPQNAPEMGQKTQDRREQEKRKRRKAGLWLGSWVVCLADPGAVEPVVVLVIFVNGIGGVRGGAAHRSGG